MKIFYIENIRMPTEKAHGIQIMKMCEAFALLGHSVMLVVPRRKNSIKDDPFHYYNVQKIFSIKRLAVPNILFLGKLGFWLQTLFFSEMAAWFIRKEKPDLVYSREQVLLFNLYFVLHKSIWEAHRGEWNVVVKWVMKKAQKVVVISHGLKNFYSEKIGALSRDKKYIEKIIVAPDAVDDRQFTITLSKEECRNKLGLPHNKKIALYAGHLYDWKGAHILAEASQSFDDTMLAVFVGGTNFDLEEFKRKYGNFAHCLILGQKPHEEIPLYLKAADVLVLPNSGKDTLSRVYTSPIKLFEYLASSVPIVASDLPSIREVLDESNAVLVKADDPDALGQGIKKLFGDKELADIITRKMPQYAREHTWVKRAERIMN